MLHWRGESLSSRNKVFISGKSGFCAITYPLFRFKYCTFWISDSWQNSLCDERKRVFSESRFYQLHWSLRPHSWLAEHLHSHCEKPEVVQLNKTCYTCAFHEMGGLVALNDFIFHNSILCCFSSQGKRENVENWEGCEKKISSPHASSRFASLDTFIGLLFPHKKIHAVKSVFVMSAS